MRLVLTCLFCLWGKHFLSAQQLADRTVQREAHSWFRYRLIIPMQQKWIFQQEVEERLQLAPLRQSEFRLRSHLVRPIGKAWEAEVAGAAIWELNELPNSSERTPQLELRFHQQLAFAHPLGNRFAMQHAYRIEERFLRNQNAQGYYRDAGISFAYLRLRYELEVEYMLSKRVVLEAVEEIVFQIGPQARPLINPFYRNELAFGIEFLFSENVGLKAQYSYRYKLDGVEEIEHEHIGRFTLEHVLRPKTK